MIVLVVEDFRRAGVALARLDVQRVGAPQAARLPAVFGGDAARRRGFGNQPFVTVEEESRIAACCLGDPSAERVVLVAGD